MRERERASGMLYEYPIQVGQNYLFGSPHGSPKIISSGPYSYRYEKCFDFLHQGPPYRDGGPFDLYQVETDRVTLIPDEPVYVDYGNYGYLGRFYPAYWNSSGWLGITSLDDFKQQDLGNVFSWGAVGWNRFRPTKSQADLGQFIGEFHDIPRMLESTALDFHKLWKSMGGHFSKFSPKSVANRWLNTQFGWKPFLNDLRSLYMATVDLDKRLDDTVKSNGQWLERSGTLHRDKSDEVVYELYNQPGFQPLLNTYLYRKIDGVRLYGWRRVVKWIEQSIWFSGRFRYYIPDWKRSWYWKANAVAMLYGARPTPSLIWELTPWSWLIDWWTNAGDVIANIESIALDNLAAKYAYVMGTTKYRIEYEGHNYLVDNVDIHGKFFEEYTRKTRVEASPFGFGLTGQDFTARQWSILSALGLSRLKYGG